MVPTGQRGLFRRARLKNKLVLTCASPRPIAEVLKASLPRVLAMQGVIPPPSNAAIKADHYSDALQPVLNALKSLPARPSLGAASSLLLENGFRCMAATNGGLESTRGLFKNALGDQVAQRWEYYSCDEDRVAKPAPSVYAAIRKRLEVGRDDESWFVASHTWSVEDSFRMFIGPGLDQGTDN